MNRRSFLQTAGAASLAEFEVKGGRYPVKWACNQKTNPDGSLTLERNVRS